MATSWKIYLHSIYTQCTLLQIVNFAGNNVFFIKKSKKMAPVFLLFVHKSFSLISFYLHNYSWHKILCVFKNFTILVFLGKQHKIFSYFFWNLYEKPARQFLPILRHSSPYISFSMACHGIDVFRPKYH